MKRPNVNPQPDNYKIIFSYEYEKWLLLIIKYPNCTTFEGQKILLFKDVSLKQIESQKLIDPHFSDSKIYFHPIARFEPTTEGIKLAYKIILGN